MSTMKPQIYRPQKTPTGCDPALTVVRMEDGSLAARHPAKVYLGRLDVDAEKQEVRVSFPFRMVDFTTFERLNAGIEQESNEARVPADVVLPSLPFTLPAHLLGRLIDKRCVHTIVEDLQAQIPTLVREALEKVALTQLDAGESPR
jgi:hypothetical protein